MTKAIVHHVLATAGESVPARTAAFVTDVDWARLQSAVLDRDTSAWLKARLNRRCRQDGPVAELARTIGATPAWNGSVAGDLAA
jgi:hypothetical protein